MLIINGLVVKDPKDPRAIAYHAQKLAQANRPYYYYNALTFLILIVIATSVRTYLSDPFRLHSIPAAARHPADHAPYFASDDMLVRTIMEPRFPTTRNFTNSTGSRKFLDSFWRSGFDEGEELSASAGGRHGHVPEAIDVDNESETGESLRVTRCSTVAAALTAYFCGGDAVTAYSNGTLPEYSNDDGSLNLFLKSAAILNTRDVVRVSIGGERSEAKRAFWKTRIRDDVETKWLPSLSNNLSNNPFAQKDAPGRTRHRVQSIASKTSIRWSYGRQ